MAFEEDGGPPRSAVWQPSSTRCIPTAIGSKRPIPAANSFAGSPASIRRRSRWPCRWMAAGLLGRPRTAGSSCGRRWGQPAAEVRRSGRRRWHPSHCLASLARLGPVQAASIGGAAFAGLGPDGRRARRRSARLNEPDRVSSEAGTMSWSRLPGTPSRSGGSAKWLDAPVWSLIPCDQFFTPAKFRPACPRTPPARPAPDRIPRRTPRAAASWTIPRHATFRGLEPLQLGVPAGHERTQSVVENADRQRTERLGAARRSPGPRRAGPPGWCRTACTAS